MDDHNQIANRIAAVAIHVDARRWEPLLDLFAPEVLADWTSLFGGEPQTLPRDQLIANWRQLLPGFTRTTHIIGTPLITLMGDVAEAAASVTAWHFLQTPELKENDWWLVGGSYEFSFARDATSWRIDSMSLVRAWSRGNQDLPRLAAERGAKCI
jgi:hypothetical protein